MHINCYEQASHPLTSHLLASHLLASRLQSIHIKKRAFSHQRKGSFRLCRPGLPQVCRAAADPPGCRRSALLSQSSLRYMASPKLKKR